RLDILDQHFRGRAVSLLEHVQEKVLVRVLMGQDPAWPRTEKLLEQLRSDVQSRIQIRAWPDAQNVPWHYRCLIGDREIWKSDHSFDGVGKKKFYLTDASENRDELRAEFDEWWRESKQIFPKSNQE